VSADSEFPVFFCLVAKFQAANGGFLPFRSDPLYIQCVLYLSIILLIVGSKLTTPIQNVGNVESTEFTISNLHVWFRNWDVDTNLFSIVCTSGNQSSTHGLFGPRGSPK
jgi:hypothetical protein